MTCERAGVSAPPDLVFTTFIRATPEAVWRAITESDFTVRYYYGSTVESDWAPGSPYVYRIDGQPALEGVILESVPERRLVMTFHATWDDKVAADHPSRMTWELEPAGPGVTKVTVIHGGFEAANETYRQAEGAAYILAGLKTLLETGSPLAGG